MGENEVGRGTVLSTDGEGVPVETEQRKTVRRGRRRGLDNGLIRLTAGRHVYAKG